MTQLPHAAIPDRGRAHPRPSAHRRAHGSPRHRHQVAAAPRPIVCAPGSPRSAATTSQLNIQEIKQPEVDAALIAQGGADQLAGRVNFPPAMKRAVQNAPEGRRARRAGAVSGRLNGRRDEPHRVVPRGRCRSTLPPDIDYGFREAKTTYGRIG